MSNTIFPGKAGNASSIAASRMLALIEATAWDRTPLGPISAWPASIRAATRIMLGSGVPMCLLVGREGVMIYNDGYAAIAGQRHPDILGRPVLEAWPEVADFNRTVLEKVFEGAALEFVDQRLELQRNGRPETLWFDLEYSPVFDDSGTVLAVLAMVFDKTRQVEVESALKRTEDRLALALSAADAIGVWDWDLVADRVYSDARFARMFNLAQEEADSGLPIARYIEAVHPEDRQGLTERIGKATETGEAFSHEYRMLDTDGTVRWVMARGKCVFDADGRCIRLPGVLVDITDQKRVADALRESEAMFRTLADAMPQMIWSTRPDGFHDYYNARWYEFTGVPDGSTDGDSWNGVFHPEDQPKAWEKWRHSLATGDPYEIEYRLRHHSGEYRWTLGRAMPIRDARGRITRWFGTCTDIHQTRAALEEREVLAHELSHRIKNIFSVLSGIISLSARSYPEAKPFAERLRARIYAMGQAHELVRPHSAASRAMQGDTTLTALFKVLLDPFVAENADVAIEGDSIDIDENAATGLALLIHELATNAAKYGALSTSEGVLRVNVALDGDTVRIEWRETSPVVDADAPLQPGFGSKLMSLSVESQFRGTMERNLTPEGLQVTIAIPRDALKREKRLTWMSGTA